MPKSKHSPEFRAKVSQEYLDGIGSIQFLADKYSIGYSTLKGWINEYQIHGIAAFCHPSNRNRTYSKEFKLRCVEAVLNGEGTVDDIIAKYAISSRSVLRSWIKVYNANREFKDYNPKREVYMAGARRKTSLSERKEIVEYCLSHGKNYKDTAARYDVSYSQVYDWVRKYVADGETGLIDRRGHHKTDEEVDEMERLRRENRRLKRQLEEQERLVYFLKKLKGLEGR